MAASLRTMPMWWPSWVATCDRFGLAFTQRRFYAMAERGDLPPVLATTDPQTGAPRMAIGLTWLLACGLSLSGTFVELAVLGVVARFAR